MELLHNPIDVLLHLDRYLGELLREYNTGVYLILFLIVFAETGLVVTPFLPGDSLLFAAGAFAGQGSLNIGYLYVLFLSAAVLGDNTNYCVGRFLGPRLFRGEKSRMLNRKHLERTHAFFERHGGKTLIMARFVPIVRTFAPFVAGIGSMTYPRFFLFSLGGNVLWVTVCCVGGYLLGSIPIVKNNFEKAVIGIILISVLPMAIEVLRHRRAEKRRRPAEPALTVAATEDANS